MGDQEQKTKLARIARLARRLELADRVGASPALIAVIRGILDLLADEL